MSEKTVATATWHADERTKDGVLRHPADAENWKTLDRLHPKIGDDPRNIRLAMATDGFNPFGAASVAHSTWPVILIPYNFAPWLCMKPENFILSLLIPGPKSP